MLDNFVGDSTIQQVQDMDFFQCCTLWFWNVAHALINLRDADILRLELSIDPITHFCGQRAREEDSRGTSSGKFHRIFLSNIPDYIGFLSVVTEVAPLLHRPSKLPPTFIQCNV